MTGAVYPPTRTVVNGPDFMAAMQKALPDSTREMRAVLTAHVFLESGRLRSTMNFNFGNIKATEDEDHTYFATTEWFSLPEAQAEVLKSSPGGTCRVTHTMGDRAAVLYFPNHPMCRFRAYASIDAGMADYVALLRTKYAKAWAAAETGDPIAYVAALKSHGYFTGDFGAYSKAVSSLFNEVLRTSTMSNA